MSEDPLISGTEAIDRDYEHLLETPVGNIDEDPDEWETVERQAAVDLRTTLMLKQQHKGDPSRTRLIPDAKGQPPEARRYHRFSMPWGMAPTLAMHVAAVVYCYFFPRVPALAEKAAQAMMLTKEALTFRFALTEDNMAVPEVVDTAHPDSADAETPDNPTGSASGAPTLH